MLGWGVENMSTRGPLFRIETVYPIQDLIPTLELEHDRSIQISTSTLELRLDFQIRMQPRLLKIDARPIIRLSNQNFNR